MSTATPHNRNRLIAGIAILVVFILGIVYMVSRFPTFRVNPSHVGSHVPASALTYCSMDQSHLCVVSFGQIVNGPMRVDFLAPSADYPEPVLKVINNGTESTYECQNVEETPENIYCTGNVQPPGAILQLGVYARSDNALLAKGTFSLIGVALLTPEVSIEESGHKLSPQLGFRIPEAPRRSHLSSDPTSVATPSPNPSYP